MKAVVVYLKSNLIRLIHLFLVSILVAIGCEQMSNDREKNASKIINELTERERQNGWKLLFDGKTSKGWRGAGMDSFPEKGWVIENGSMIVLAAPTRSDRPGDILTVNKYSDFELALEFKVEKGGNSGIKYLTQETPKIALEYQILDDANHPDAKNGRDGNRTVGALYDLIPPENKQVNPVGQWNHARIIVDRKHIEHWLNGSKILSFMRGSENFKTLVAKSKYKSKEGFGKIDEGHILLQDHGDKVSFRNIKIKEL